MQTFYNATVERVRESRLIERDTSNVDKIDWDPRYYFINAVDTQEHEVAEKLNPVSLHKSSLDAAS